MPKRSITRTLAAGSLACAAVLFAGTSTAMAQDQPAPGQSAPLFDDLAEYSIERLGFGFEAGEVLTTEVMLGEQAYTLELTPYSLRASDFQVLVQQPDGTTERRVPPPSTTYRGTVKDVAGSVVTAGFFEGSLSAVIRLSDEAEQSWVIQPLAERLKGADASLHVVHRELDDLSAVGGICGTPDNPLGVVMPAMDPAGPGVDETLVLELAVDTDFEFFQLRGSETSVISAVETQVNAVSGIYERDIDTAIEITTIIVRPTSADPYTTSDGSSLLQQMTSHWRTQQRGVRRDTASLISGRDFVGGVLGVAWLPGTCTTTQGYNVNQYPGLGVAARNAVLAHELGHNNNAPHCSGGDCRIMCAGIGGCSGDIFRFGSLSSSRIRAYLDAVSCIDPLETEPDPQPLPFEDNFDASTTLDPDKWAEAANVVVTPAVFNPISAPNALSLQVDATLTTTRYDIPAGQPTYVNIWSQHRFVEPGKFLRVEYYSTFNEQYEPLGTIQSDGSDQQQFVFNQFRLPLVAVGTEFRLRITAQGSDASDAWYIDSVSIDEFCRADLTKDGVLDLFDFLAFQTAFDQGSPVADFTSDTALNVFDFLEFQNQFGGGCD